jgi:DNA-binding NarL/FixJ family response regulator
LLRSHPDIKVVVVTVCEEDPFPTRLLQAGAAGYLTKGAGLAEMVQAIDVSQHSCNACTNEIMVIDY